MAFLTILVLFLGSLFIYGVYSLVKDDLELIAGPIFPQYHVPSIGPAYAFLERSFPYYQALSPAGKQKFIKRLKVMLHTKEFIGAHGFKVTDEMHYYILACWVQITFGLKRYKILSFNKVMLFKQGFYSNRIKREVKGMVAHNGTIYLSWADFVEGYTHPNDNYNLGIHELSHAFLISTYTNGDFDVDFASYIDEWFEVTKTEFYNIAEGIPSYLREYAGTNNYEFFSVCMEVFFENPLELKTKLPDIFYHLCYLLNQNPLNPSADYVFDKTSNINLVHNIPLPTQKKRSIKYIGSHWLYSIPIICFLSGILAIQAFLYTLVPVSNLLLVIATGLAIGLYKRVAIQNYFGKRLAGLFIVFVCALGLPGLALNINYYFKSSDTETELYTIVDTEVKEIYNKNGTYRGPQTTIYLKNDSLYGNFLFRQVRGYYTLDEGYRYQLKVYYHYGILGFKVLEVNEILKYNAQTGERE